MTDMIVVPDYLPDQFSVWYFLNTYIQKNSGQNISLQMPESFAAVEEIQKKQPAGMIYVNPFDAGRYVRESGYLPLVRPHNKFDEVVIVCPASSAYQAVEDIKGPVRLALSHNEDANFIGQRLLEPAGLEDNQWNKEYKDNFLMVASSLIRDQADVGIIQAEVYENFNDLTKKQLKVLLKSRINEVSHVWLYRPEAAETAHAVLPVLTSMTGKPDAQKILDDLGIPEGFAALSEEEMEFMIDLVDTLRA